VHAKLLKKMAPGIFSTPLSFQGEKVPEAKYLKLRNEPRVNLQSGSKYFVTSTREGLEFTTFRMLSKKYCMLQLCMQA
jgi:hypothetical protein